MVTKVQKWGNSQGLRLSKQILDEAKIAVGDRVDVMVQDGAIVVAAVEMVRGRHSLKELVSRIPADHEAQELDWPEPMGQEAW